MLFVVPVSLPGKYFEAELAIEAVDAVAAESQAKTIVETLQSYAPQANLAVGLARPAST